MRSFKRFLSEGIKKRGDNFVVTDSSGDKVLGTHDTRKKALKQLAAVEISKKKKLSEQRGVMLAGVLGVATTVFSEQYTVQKGDYLGKLGNVKEILKLNPQIKDPDMISPGQKINLPGKNIIVPKATPKVASKPAVTGTESFAKDLVQYEGRRSHLYKDHKGNPTIGIGHLIGPDSKKRFEAAGLGDKYEGCVSGKCGLNDNEQDKLVQQDLTDVYVPRAEKLVNNFERLNPEAQSAIVGSVFRGGLSGSPNALGLINQGKFKEAGKEFLNSKEYRTSKKAGTGVYKRMDSYAKAISSATLRPNK